VANVLARWKGRERPVAFAVLCLLIAFGLTTSQPETSLAQTGGKPNILFILTDDLRFMPKTQNLLADQGVTFKIAFVTRSLCCPSEEAIRVPLLVRGPGVSQGVTRSQMALNTDFAPTFADLAGVIPPGFVDGRSLSPILSATPPATWRTAFSVEHRRSKEEYPYVCTIPNYDAVRTASHLYVEYETGEKELYNLSKDPYDLTNRYASATSTLRSDLRARLNALRGCAGPE
jgi:N-acetylglucosamine-6-sulfatase